MKLDIPYILPDLFDLTKFDPTYSEEKYNNLLKHKNQLSSDELNQDDYLQYFKDFELVYTTIQILFSYDFLLNEFERGEHPLFDSIKDLKKHNASLNPYLNAIEKTLKITSLFEDNQTNEKLERTIQFIQKFQNNPEDFINRLYFFQILKMTLANKMPDVSEQSVAELLKILLMHNPYDDPSIQKLEDCNFYFGLLKLFDGYNINAEMLLSSTVIKIHKLFALFDQENYKKRSNSSKVILSIFQKMGKNPKIDLERIDNVVPKTFYKGNAIFDYGDNKEKYLVNLYFDNGLRKGFDFMAMKNRSDGKIESISRYDEVYTKWINRLYLILLTY